MAGHEAFSFNPFPVHLFVSFPTTNVLEDVINSFLQIVKDHQAILLSHGLFDVLEARGSQNLDDLDVPDPDQIGDAFGQSGGFMENFNLFSL
jgi:hypothetical protein